MVGMVPILTCQSKPSRGRLGVSINFGGCVPPLASQQLSAFTTQEMVGTGFLESSRTPPGLFHVDGRNSSTHTIYEFHGYLWHGYPWNLCNSPNLPKVALTNNAKIYVHHPEKRSFRFVNLFLVVTRYYIYTATKESKSYSITALKVL